jgi:uncharacterized Zn finger protein
MDDDTLHWQLCPACSGTEAVLLGSMLGGRVHVRCRDCGTVYEIDVPDSFEPDDSREDMYE